ncbi:hypothetical protein NUW58_g170 [Xylaria curta]|uniref:Uncharacterized protein n=1 Tax=Xylaria curta TaxID=42375 RepID=A0ACC1PQR7_9PEZI|nr:hypothetical protein NUW58_g170 [Xylaria curta]
MDAAAFAFPTEPLDRGLSQKSQVVLGVTWTFFALALLCLFLRFYLTRKFRRPFTPDDWVMLLALALHTLFQVFFTLNCIAGFGYEMQTMTIQQIVDMGKWAWATVPLNLLANLASRVSITLLLVHIFSVRTWFKRLIITKTALLTTIGLANFIFIFFQASPFPASWDFRIPAKWRLSHEPHNILIFTELILFVLSDFIDGMLPALLVWKLHMPLQQKLLLMIMMAGTLITMGIAIGRAAIVSDSLNKSTDASAKDGMNPAKVYVIFGVTSLLASVEISLLIILGSGPKLRVISKLSVFDKISSSVASVFSRLWPGTQLSVSKSGSRPDEGASDVELNKVGAVPFPEHPGGCYSSFVQHERHGMTPQHSKENQMDHITVTESYAVTHNQSPKQTNTQV